MRYYLGGSNNYRATWVSDTIPRVMTAGTTYSVTVTVRNDGWDTWSEAGMYRLDHAIVASGVTPATSDYDANPRHAIPGGASIAPGQSVTFSFTITAPGTAGSYDLYYDMVRDGVAWFRAKNNIEWKKQIRVAASVANIDSDGDGIPDIVEQTSGSLWWNPADGYAFTPTTPGTPSAIGSGSSITFSWTPSTVPGCGIAGYYCQVGTGPGTTDVRNGYNGPGASLTVTNCSWFSHYYCRVRPISDAGFMGLWSQWSAGVLPDDSPPTTPGTPMSPAGAYTTSTSITFAWAASSDSGAGVRGYTCQIGTSPNACDVLNAYVGNSLSRTVTVPRGAAYYCRVQAMDNAENTSAWSASSTGIAVVDSAEPNLTAAKGLPDLSWIGLSTKTVSAVFAGALYIEELDLWSGIKVKPGLMPSGIAPGRTVDVGGALKTDANGERYIDGCVKMR